MPKFDLKNCGDYKDIIFEINKDRKDPIYIMPILESEMIARIESRTSTLIKIKNELDSMKNYVLNVRVGGNDFSNLYGLRRGVDRSIYQNGVIRDILTDIINEYNNSLSHVYTDGYYIGNVILTNINNEQDTYTIPVRVSDIFYNNISVKLPNVTGEYKVHIDLTEKQYKSDFTPYAIPDTTSFVDSISVELLSNDEEAKIYYTVDGSEPTEKTGVLYAIPLVLTESTNIKAVAVNSYGEYSDIAEFNYTKTIIPKVETPIIANNSNTFSGTKVIEIICNTEGAEIYYTLDGSEPSINSIKYVEPFEISETTTIKVLAVKEGLLDSDIAAYTFRKTTGGNGGGGGGGGSSSHVGSNEKSSSNASKNNTSNDIPDVETIDKNEQDSSEKTEVSTTYKFSDVITGSWAEESIMKMAELGFINGVGNGKFLPDNNAKRADFVLIITKMLNLSGKAKTNFDDVYPNMYYYDALGLAKENNIIYGVGENKFNPEMNISRQDAMVMLCRILELKGFEMENDTDVLSDYVDTDKISDYAKESIAKLVSSEIVVGNNKKIEPQKNITRAEMSVMLYKAYELLLYGEKD